MACCISNTQRVFQSLVLTCRGVACRVSVQHSTAHTPGRMTGDLHSLSPNQLASWVPLSCFILQAPKEWFFYPNSYDPERFTKNEAPAAAGAGPAPVDGSTPATNPAASPSYQVGDEVVPGADESGRAGPMSKDALRQLHARGVITGSSWVWAAGMASPQQLSQVRELRWMLGSGLGLLGPFDAALVALQVRGEGWRGEGGGGAARCERLRAACLQAKKRGLLVPTWQQFHSWKCRHVCRMWTNPANCVLSGCLRNGYNSEKGAVHEGCLWIAAGKVSGGPLLPTRMSGSSNVSAACCMHMG